MFVGNDVMWFTSDCTMYRRSRRSSTLSHHCAAQSVVWHRYDGSTRAIM